MGGGSHTRSLSTKVAGMPILNAPAAFLRTPAHPHLMKLRLTWSCRLLSRRLCLGLPCARLLSSLLICPSCRLRPRPTR
jgi:hypothetical protein